MMDLKERFQHICFQHSQDQNLIDNLWSEIEKKYSKKKDIIMIWNILKICFLRSIR
ncbi:hypothetical protein J3D55_001674 [Chryseobacterium ginsenosidimutans]|nr:hypothetical protein [Chryseobacterium ginsenosidimutans]